MSSSFYFICSFKTQTSVTYNTTFFAHPPPCETHQGQLGSPAHTQQPSQAPWISAHAFVKNRTQFHLVDCSYWSLSLFQWVRWDRLWVCACVFIHVHISAHRCVGQRSTLSAISQDTVQLVFGNKVSRLAWGLSVWLGWLVSDPQGSAISASQGLGSEANATTPIFSHGFWELNSELHT